MTFIKHDADKPVFSLIEPAFLEGLANILTHGATKYSSDNWKRCETSFTTYYSALQRHLNAYASGEPLDPESGYSHLHHAACCLMFLEYFQRMASIDSEIMGTIVSTVEAATSTTSDPHPQGPPMTQCRALPKAD